MAVAGKRAGQERPVADMGLEKLLVDTAAEKGGDMDLEFFGVHVVDQVHQHLLGTALAQIVDQKEDLFHACAPCFS